MTRFRVHPGSSACPAGWEITRALSQPDSSAEILLHLRDCPGCAELAAELQAVVSSAASLPPIAPLSQASLDHISRVLGAAIGETKPPSARPRRAFLAWAFAGTLASIVIGFCGWRYLARRSPPRELAQEAAGLPAGSDEMPSLARLRVFGEAQFQRISGPPDEVVHLKAGRLAFEVAHLTSTQRFRVVTGDGEVEVRGTRFEVVVRDEALWSVRVLQGGVDVRVGQSLSHLQAGDEWQRQQPVPAAASAATVGQDGPAKAEPTSQPDRAKPTTSGSNKESFDRAWSHLRRQEWEQAMHGFATVAAQAHNQGLEEDALYWQAVATARMERSREASQLFRAIVQRFPRGARAGAATLALAWLNFDAGNREAARVLFEQAARDPSARVREGAAEGLLRLPVQ